MISYERDQEQTIPESSVKIIGLGGAGANMLDRVALDGLTGAEMLCVNTDIRTLSSSVAGDKVQIGKDLTKGLGCGGDPELGQKAALEAEAEIRKVIKGHQMIFLCVGLGGGTGSGAAPLITRIAREENAFVVVFATMPFSFEGQRRRDQAETTLNELAVLANALVTFDNGRMGELVLAKQGIHEAFSAADRMISESIKAVTRLVIRPGLINVGLDDLMTALRTTRSRCLFGSGIAEGENRAHLALENALASPLLDKGGLLADSTTVLVHICGGESLTLYETELLMQNLGKYIPTSAHVLFGAAVDPTMGESLSVTLISALPEDQLTKTKISPEATKQLNQKTKVDPPLPVANKEIKKEEKREKAEETPLEPEKKIKKEVKEVAKEKEKEQESAPTEELEKSPPEKIEEKPEPHQPPEEKSEPKKPLEEAVEESEPKSTKAAAQPELLLDGAPKGKFEGENPNFHDGEDLDIPPFLRKKRR